MRLKRVKIQGYQCLKNTEISFEPAPLETEDFSAQLLVGRNGLGKSCFLEALGLILTRIMQDETPGFAFELEYQTSKGRLLVKIDGVQTDRIPEECRPQRIVAYCSGASHRMDSILLRSPKDSLASDLFDLSAGKEGYAEELSHTLRQYELLDTDPRVLLLDAGVSRMVLPALFAVLPGYEKEETALEYLGLREELTRSINKSIQPVAFSITVQLTRLREYLNQYSHSPQYGRLERMIRWEGLRGASDYGGAQ